MEKKRIKVSDLLKESGKQDSITFEKLTIDLPGLTPDGVSGNLHLTSYNNDTIEAQFTDITCELEDTCQRCNKSFIRSVWCDFYETTFTKDPETYEDDTVDVLFPIDDKENIDVSEALTQAIQLQEPVTILCYDCVNQLPDDDEDDVEYYETQPNIKFS